LRNFILQLSALTLIVGIIYYLLNTVIAPRFYFPEFAGLLILFFLVTFLFHLGLQRSNAKNPSAFVRYYMGASGVKLAFFLTVIIIYALVNKSQAMTFAITFFAFYLIYTTFEVSIAYKQFGRKPSQETQNQNESFQK